ncbi:sensory box histidine kinase [Fulvimarina pelagi HTCC2506]|uniref:Sensory box histidine kinase n=1 Tax=Fulvimarina pelagi HTCC2506 TaxID=314231 RepID=Q0G496_9HYPH|nr:PAS domain-containing protein [Fulvimarina pelagi]EAU41585.1 sensory box histidine kinase [Fulvimarina pelagi HTCC2506]
MDQRDTNDQDGFSMPSGMSTAALSKLPLALVLTNPHLDDNPIIYANRAFETITGYSAGAIIGRNCRFLQGENTDPEHVRRISEALRNEEDVTVEIENYRADGTKFLNKLMITPLYDDHDNLQCFLGVQRDMTADQEAAASKRSDAALGEIQHRVKNHLSMIIGMIRMQARMKTSEESFSALARRIESLQLLYQEMTDAGVGSTNSEMVPLGAYVSRIASTIGHLDGRRSVRVNVDCDAITLKVDRAARIGLLFSELLTNALKHAFDGRQEGLVEARLKMLSSGVVRLTVVDDGVGLNENDTWPYSSKKPPRALDKQSMQKAIDDTRKEVEADAELENEARQIASSLGMGKGERPPAEKAKGGALTETERQQVDQGEEKDTQEGGLGGRIVMSLVRGLNAKLDVNSDTVGTTVTVDIPPDA